MYSNYSWNFLGLSPAETNFKEAKFVVVPVPYDSTVSYRSGSRKGPHSVIEASRYVELFDIELNQEHYKKGVFTINFEYSRPWEGGEKAEWTFELEVHARERS